jgi:hypothetical protein
MFRTRFIKKIKKHFISKFFRKSYRLYEIMWKNNVETDMPQMAIRRMRTACWIHNATNTLSQCVILLAFPLQKWLHERPQYYVICTLLVLLKYRVGRPMYQRFGKTHLESDGLSFYSYCLYCQFLHSKIRHCPQSTNFIRFSKQAANFALYVIQLLVSIKEMANVCRAERIGCLNKTNYVLCFKG